MDLPHYDAYIHMSYQVTKQPKSSYYVMDTPIAINTTRLNDAINSPRHHLTLEESATTESIRQAILAFANKA